MIKTSIPVVYAVHPAWTGELDRLALNPLEAATGYQERIKAYMGPAHAFQNLAFREGEVYQIAENEYYSYHDGLRYMLTASGARVVIIHMQGLLSDSFYFSDYVVLANKIKAAEDPAYAGVLILSNCPGGMVQGMTKLNAAIEDYSKPIGCFVSGYHTSAAAFVTAPCDLIIGDQDMESTWGSIGVFSIQQNYAKHHEQEGIETVIYRNAGADEKFKPNNYEPWRPEDRAEFQSRADRDGAVFHAAMTGQRKLSADQMEEVKKGGTYTNADAIRLGLCDSLGTLEGALEAIENYSYQLLFI